MVTRADIRPSPRASLALVLAAAYGAALLVAGFLAPVYQTHDSSSSGSSRTGSATLVGENGVGAVVVLTVPLVVTVAVGAALRMRRRRPAVATAWALTGLLALGNLLAMLSIGVFVLPVTVALIVACSTSWPPRTGGVISKSEAGAGSPPGGAPSTRP